MIPDQKVSDGLFNRGTGLLVIEVRNSNPNGDPDTESDPRMINDEYGLISPPSFKRKMRDLVADKEGYAWTTAKEVLNLESKDDQRIVLRKTHSGTEHSTERKEIKARYNVLETRFRKRDEIKEMDAFQFAAEFWDARLFGNTFLESLKDKDENEKVEKEINKNNKTKKMEEQKKRDHFISTGVVQFGPGISIAPISVIRSTFTSKAGVEDDKDRGMAPLAWRVVQHAVYIMPFFANPCMWTKTGCGLNDLKLMQYLIPYAYRLTASLPRTHVEFLHAWYAEHTSPLGSCPDSLIIDALTPEKVEGEKDKPSTSIKEYKVPDGKDLSKDIRSRLASLEDLCVKKWA